jgi:hypothetical protein
MALNKWFAIGTEPFDAPVRDRRGYARYPCYIETFCRTLGQETDVAWLGTIRDMSSGGLRLHVSRRFEADARLALEVPASAAGVLPPSLDVHVVHVRPAGPGEGWVLGCALRDRRFSDNELKALL